MTAVFGSLRRAPPPGRDDESVLRALIAALLLPASTPSAAAASRYPLPGAPGALLQPPAQAQQLNVVSSPTADPAVPGDLATLTAFARSSRSAPWRSVLGPWQAETGYGHLRVTRREGDGATPVGVFQFGATVYGTRPDPGSLRYPYHRLVCGDWWDEDPYSALYNLFVHVPCGVTPPFASRSEPLWTETIAYPYFAVIQFNAAPTIGGAQAPGSGIFLHSWIGEPTHGCIALPEPRLLEVLRWLHPAAHPVIEIGTDAEVYPGR